MAAPAAKRAKRGDAKSPVDRYLDRLRAVERREEALGCFLLRGVTKRDDDVDEGDASASQSSQSEERDGKKDDKSKYSEEDCACAPLVPSCLSARRRGGAEGVVRNAPPRPRLTLVLLVASVARALVAVRCGTFW